MHPVPEGSGTRESHKLGDDVLMSGRLTTVSAAQEIISDVANKICSLKSCGHLDLWKSATNELPDCWMRVETRVCKLSDRPRWSSSTWPPRQVLNVPFSSFCFASLQESDGCSRVHVVFANLGKQWPRELTQTWRVSRHVQWIIEQLGENEARHNSVQARNHMELNHPARCHCQSSSAHRVSGWLSLGSAKVDMVGLFGTVGEAPRTIDTSLSSFPRQCRHAPSENCVCAAQLPSLCAETLLATFRINRLVTVSRNGLGLLSLSLKTS